MSSVKLCDFIFTSNSLKIFAKKPIILKKYIYAVCIYCAYQMTLDFSNQT